MLRYGATATGLIVGLLGAPGTFLPNLESGSFAAQLPLALFLPLARLFALFSCPGFRLLMVWVYDRTQSMLMAMLMHLAGVVCGFVLLALAMVGIPDLVFNLAFGAALWIVVAAVATADRRRSLRSEKLQSRSPGAGDSSPLVAR